MHEAMTTRKTIDFEAIKQAADSKWQFIIPALTQLSAEVLTRGKEDHPCPLCNGASVIWPASGAEETGSIACRKCTDNKPTGDGIATVARFAGKSQLEAAKDVANYLGIDGESTQVQLDVIAEVCKAKRMPLDAFMQFEPTIAKRGRDKVAVARVPVYNELGEKHSYFDLTPTDKGWNARGKGASGMFFPGRLPQPGETWHLVEGVKDAAALIGLGFNAAGLPTSCMADKYARLFAGCNVILVPDLDKTGQDGAQKTGGRLVGIAASVRVARLPGEVVEKGGHDVRDILSREEGEKLVRQAIEAAKPWMPREGEQDPKDGRPEVLVTLAYGWVCDQVCKYVGKLDWETDWLPPIKREPLKVYQRGGSLVQVVVSDDEEQLQGVGIPAGTARIRPLPTGQIPLRIADACQLMQETEVDGEIERVAVPPQRWLIDGIATRGDWGRLVRRLSGVVTAPTIRPDGTILQVAGYDGKTGLLLYPGATKFPPVPDKPSLADAQRAAAELLEVVKDFPFVDDADQSAWLALVLSLIGRSAIPGCVPLFGITANCRGSGKSLQADAASLIAYGRHAPRKTFSGDDDEQRKAITATAIEALPSVLLDNVDCTLGGSSLDAALTATTWSDRVLGASKTTGELPLRTVWMATGNNLRFGSDLARRVLPIRLAAMQESPEERTDFEHCDLLAWVAENRPRLAIAALTILRAYFVAGRPVQAGGVWGSYENWSALVRGSIVWAGLADPLKTRETAKADDQSGAIVRGLIGGLLEVDETGEGLTAREIADQLNNTTNADRFPTLREVAAEVATVRGVVDSKKLGYQLRKFKGRIVVDAEENKWQIAGEPGHGGLIRWTAKPIHGWDGGNGGDALPVTPGETCVSHTHTHATHIERDGQAGKQYQPSPPSQPQTTLTPVRCKCGSGMQPAELVNGWRNWDCPECKTVKPVREVPA